MSPSERATRGTRNLLNFHLIHLLKGNIFLSVLREETKAREAEARLIFVHWRSESTGDFFFSFILCFVFIFGGLVFSNTFAQLCKCMWFN